MKKGFIQFFSSTTCRWLFYGRKSTRTQSCWQQWADRVLHSTHLSLVVSDLLVKLLALQTDEVLPGLNDATLGCDGAGGVNIVSSNHTYSNACTLALSDSLRDLK